MGVKFTSSRDPRTRIVNHDYSRLLTCHTVGDAVLQLVRNDVHLGRHLDSVGHTDRQVQQVGEVVFVALRVLAAFLGRQSMHWDLPCGSQSGRQRIAASLWRRHYYPAIKKTYLFKRIVKCTNALTSDQKNFFGIQIEIPVLNPHSARSLLDHTGTPVLNRYSVRCLLERGRYFKKDAICKTLFSFYRDFLVFACFNRVWPRLGKIR